MKTLLSLSLLTVSLVVGVLLAELVVRVGFPAYHPAGSVAFQRTADGVPLASPGFVGRQWKNTGDYDVPIRINRHGLRDGKDLVRAGPHDWFVVGDSFTFGHGVREEERFSNLLQDFLAEPVYNLGIPTDIDGYARLLNHARARGAAPQRLLVAICMENDLLDYHREQPAVLPVLAAPRWRLGALKARFTRSSALYNLATTAIHRTPPLRDLAIRLGLLRPNLAGMPGPAREAAVQSSAARLSMLLEAQSLEVAAVVLIPSRGLWAGPEREAHATVHRRFKAALEKHGIRVIDLRAAFEASGKPLSLHFDNDGHWNPAGHLRAARVIHDRLRAWGWTRGVARAGSQVQTR